MIGVMCSITVNTLKDIELYIWNGWLDCTVYELYLVKVITKKEKNKEYMRR